jgi:putative ABC transport system permease protein
MMMSRGEVKENLLNALATLRGHKVRSGLTVLGIVIGVTSVISVASIIDGLNLYIQKRVESFGSRTYFISRIPFGQPPDRLPERLRTRRYLEVDYAPYLRQTCPGIELATPFKTRAFFFGQTNELHVGDRRVERIILRGAEPDYVDAIPLFAVNEGRFVSRLDEEHSRDVVVLGAAVADSLFSNTDPVGKVAYVNGRQYEVIGVFEKDPGLFGGGGVDSFAVIPLSNFQKNYPEAKETHIAFTIPKHGDPQRGVDEVTEAMRRLRHLQYHQANDFEVISSDFLTQLWNQLTGALVVLTGIISSVGLLVGGIGVMNIMLISVTERTREIGVRRAIGARKADIRVQFLLEAVLLTSTGGALGIMIGILVATIVRNAFASVPATVSLFWVVAGVAMSVGVGLFFGSYPASRAANLDPIVCLRYE